MYNSKAGKLLGYEVKEVLKSITYNTLWFNLFDTSGIASIKYQEATENTEACFYINELSTPFASKKVGGFSTKMLSRRFDIEFRTQYYDSYNEEEKVYEQIAVKVPMFFVQEEYYETVSDDVKEVNSNITFTITMENNVLSKIEADYDELIDIFILNKDNIKEENILDFIGNAMTFD